MNHQNARADPDAPVSLISFMVALPNGCDLAECITPNGETVFWLLVTDDGEPGCASPYCAPHEQPGRLPAATRKRVHTCAAPTKSGRPCSRATPPGQRCPMHTLAEEEPAT